MASEPKIRVRKQVGSYAGCGVNAQGLLEPVRWQLSSCNLSGTAGYYPVSRKLEAGLFL